MSNKNSNNTAEEPTKEETAEEPTKEETTAEETTKEELAAKDTAKKTKKVLTVEGIGADNEIVDVSKIVSRLQDTIRISKTECNVLQRFYGKNFSLDKETTQKFKSVVQELSAVLSNSDLSVTIADVPID